MNASDYAAWWGALVASFLFVWDVYKWNKSRSNIEVTASPNMQAFDKVERKLEEDKKILIKVVNNGDKVTTITNLMIRKYKNLWKKILNKPEIEAFISDSENIIPYELEPGKQWVASIDQNDLENKSFLGDYFYCGVYHTARKKGNFVRVKFKK